MNEFKMNEVDWIMGKDNLFTDTYKIRIKVLLKQPNPLLTPTRMLRIIKEELALILEKAKNNNIIIYDITALDKQERIVKITSRLVDFARESIALIDDSIHLYGMAERRKGSPDYLDKIVWALRTYCLAEKVMDYYWFNKKQFENVLGEI